MVERLVNGDSTEDHKFVEVKDVGDHALFVSCLRSCLVSMSDFSCCRRNCIYYVGNPYRGYNGEVINLEDRMKHRFFLPVPFPTPALDNMLLKLPIFYYVKGMIEFP